MTDKPSFTPHLYKNDLPITTLASGAALQPGDSILVFLEGKDGPLTHLHPKRLKDDLVSKISNHANIDNLKLTRQGKLLVVTRSADTAAQVLSLRELVSVPVTPHLQTESITSRFLLHNIPTDVTCQEIAEELLCNNITSIEVRRFMRGNSGNRTPSLTVLVTMLGTQLPPYVKVWYQLHRISLFIDRPRPCLNCWKFNHNTRVCKSPRVCKDCGSTHEGPCTEPVLKCHNCQGSHRTDDKSCPLYLKEAQIQRFKSVNHLSIAQARREFRQVEKQGRSYASVTNDTPSPLPPDTLTKADLQEALNAFSENLIHIIKTALEVQATTLQTASEPTREDPTFICKSIIEQATSSIVQAIQKLLPSPPSGEGGSITRIVSVDHSSQSKRLRTGTSEPTVSHFLDKDMQSINPSSQSFAGTVPPGFKPPL